MRQQIIKCLSRVAEQPVFYISSCGVLRPAAQAAKMRGLLANHLYLNFCLHSRVQFSSYGKGAQLLNWLLDNQFLFIQHYFMLAGKSISNVLVVYRAKKPAAFAFFCFHNNFDVI